MIMIVQVDPTGAMELAGAFSESLSPNQLAFLQRYGVDLEQLLELLVGQGDLPHPHAGGVQGELAKFADSLTSPQWKLLLAYGLQVAPRRVSLQEISILIEAVWRHSDASTAPFLFERWDIREKDRADKGKGCTNPKELA